MRWRLYERRGSPFTCCFCCHVRTGTLLIGSFSLVLNVFSIVTTFFLIINPLSITKYGDASADLMANIYANDDEGVSTAATVSVTNSSAGSYSSNLVHGTGDQKVVELILNIGSAVFTAGLLYGVLKGRAKFLLPYFCIQVFDFCLGALVIIGFFTYEPNIKKWIAAQKDFPMKEQLMTLHNGLLVLIAGTIAVVCLWIKAYFISVVWACYKFLIVSNSPVPLHNDNMPSSADGLGGILFHTSDGAVISIPCDEASSAVSVGLDSQVLLMPPKYEDILTMSGPAATSSFPEVESAQPPPAYNEVVNQQQQQQQLGPGTQSS